MACLIITLSGGLGIAPRDVHGADLRYLSAQLELLSHILAPIRLPRCMVAVAVPG
ncbi:hypothetical protein DSUL_90075 [Desulfovibrionales bacterium]